MEVLLVQFLVLAFTGALWWLARRDLASRAAPSQTRADTQELEQLCATLEALVTDLARRLESLERQTALRHPAEGEVPLPSFAEVGALLAAPSVPAQPPVPANATMPADAASPSAADPRHVALNMLLEDGITDPSEIARRTGLGRGEVDLILSLRARRAL